MHAAASRATAHETRYLGEPAITLRVGDTAATFLPRLGMTGVALWAGDRQFLAVPGGMPALRRGDSVGLPLLAPWANRLAGRRYRAAGVTVDLAGKRLPTDGNGLPIHGLLLGAPGWTVDRRSTSRGAWLEASLLVDHPAFPFPHRLRILARVTERTLRVDTTVEPTGRRRVPVSFGWHPYLRLPRTPRSQWTLHLPPRRHLALDPSGIPTGERVAERPEAERIRRRTFDDLYQLARGRRLALSAPDGTGVELGTDAGYPYAQVWVPKGHEFASLEPMTAPTNALVDGTAPLVSPGQSFTASFTLTLTTPP